jgi:hypothetical protein
MGRLSLVVLLTLLPASPAVPRACTGSASLGSFHLMVACPLGREKAYPPSAILISNLLAHTPRVQAAPSPCLRVGPEDREGIALGTLTHGKPSYARQSNLSHCIFPPHFSTSSAHVWTAGTSMPARIGWPGVSRNRYSRRVSPPLMQAEARRHR